MCRVPSIDGAQARAFAERAKAKGWDADRIARALQWLGLRSRGIRKSAYEKRMGAIFAAQYRRENALNDYASAQAISSIQKWRSNVSC